MTVEPSRHAVEPRVTLRALIASDQPLFLDGLEALLSRDGETAVVGRCGDDDAILRNVRRTRPDLVFLDIDARAPDALRIVRRINDVVPATKVVVFTGRADDDALIEAVRLGVRGVLLKSVASSQVVECIRRVQAGGYWLEERMTTAALSRMVRREAAERKLSVAGLNARELEIAKLVGQGLQNHAIGMKLKISPASVKIHVHQIYRKLGLAGRAALMVYARENHLVRS
jgi:DNA-binding NarL/FixJ family response regulator